MGRDNLIVGSHDLQSVSKAFVNVVNAITNFLNPPHQTTSSKMRPSWISTVLNRDLRFLVKKSRLKYKNICINTTTTDLLSQISLKNSAMNNEKIFWYTD